METVMEQTLPIFVDERRCMLNVKIQVQPKKFIDIQITDEKDYFFLLMLQINENDYQNLKKEMGLLVEFSAFPKNLVELFDKCKEEKELQCRLESQTNLLSFVSISYTNLRPLVHFYLQLKSANDATLKKYLSSQVHEFKTLSIRLRSALQEAEERFETKMQEMETRLSEALKTKDAAEIEHSKLVANLKMQMSSSITDEKERALTAQRELQQEYERETKEREKKHEQKIEELQAQVESLQKESNELLSAKLELEAELKTLTSKLESTESSATQYRIRGDTESKLKISSLELQLQDKDQLIAKMSALLESCNSQKATLEESVASKKEMAGQLEEKINVLKQELQKSYKIIEKLQTQCKAFKSKAKLKTIEMNNHYQVIQEKQQIIDMSAQEIHSLKQQLAEKMSECGSLQNTIEKQKHALAGNEDLLKKNESIINYLSKEVTKLQTGSWSGSTSPNSSPPSASTTSGLLAPSSSSAYQFRPSYRSLHPNLSISTKLNSLTSSSAAFQTQQRADVSPPYQRLVDPSNSPPTSEHASPHSTHNSLHSAHTSPHSAHASPLSAHTSPSGHNNSPLGGHSSPTSVPVVQYNPIKAVK